MFNDYSTYLASDFLLDDFFVKSMLNPSDEDSAFWKRLIDENKIDVDEFIAAYTVLNDLNGLQFDIPDNRIAQLWTRIEHTNRLNIKKKKRTSLFKYTGVVASIVLLLGVSLFMLIRPSQDEVMVQSISEYASENIIHKAQPSNQILLLSKNQSLTIEGAEASLEYNDTGTLKINEQKVNLYQSKQDVERELVYNQISVPYGKRAFLSLSDGTKLWINTGTTVVYPTTFAKDKREIYVEGEVFAEVKYNSSCPFIINTNKLNIKVLGTSFNVTAYKGDKQTNVVLVTGLVNIVPKNGEETYLKPNQLFEYSETSTTLKTVDVDNYISWRDGVYVFRNEPIENILLRLSRYYNVTMKIPSSSSGITCSGKLELKEDINLLLNGLCEISSMNYAIKDEIYSVMFN